jgi:gamma-glutamyltranspeptidase / glutathione hydrolase
MLMPFHPRALTAPLAAIAVLAGSGAASLPAAAGAAVRTASLPAAAGAVVRTASHLPKQAVAVGTGGAAASDDVEATSAGLEVLRHGGNAIDGAVAVAAEVVHPSP